MYKKYIKRLLDIILSLFGLIISSPIFLIVGLLVLIFLGHPIIFKQKRPGKDEKIFTLYKFRTMTDKKDKNGNLLPDEVRLTKFGKFLRKTSLDEIPEFINNTTDISEKMLKKLILDNIPKFMKELGDGFSFIDSEYKIKIGDNYNYVDILLFNYKYKCFVVIELKVTELKKEHIGQISTYMHYIDKIIKNEFYNKTIGIIIVRKDNKFIMGYCSDDRIFRTTYELV